MQCWSPGAAGFSAARRGGVVLKGFGVKPWSSGVRRARGFYSILGIVSGLGGFSPVSLQTSLLWRLREAAAMLAAIWVLEPAPTHPAVLAAGRCRWGVFCTQLIFCSGHLVLGLRFTCVFASLEA